MRENRPGLFSIRYPEEAARDFNESIRNTNTTLNNKQDVIDYVKQQLKIDLNKAVDEDRFSTKSRAYLDIDSRKLNRNDFNSVRKLLQYDKGLRFEENGAYNYAIYYEKKKNKK